MKKSIFLILLCCCLLLVGCDYSGAGMITNSDGTIKEYYYVLYPEEQLTTPNIQTGEDAYMSIMVSRTQVLPAIKQECDKLFVGMINAYQTRIKNSQEFSIEEKTALVAGVTIASNLPDNLMSVLGRYTQIRYEISYANSACYKVFKEINDYASEDKVTQKTSNFFTTTTKVVKDPIFDKITEDAITLGSACVNLANSIMEQKLGTTLWEKIKTDLDYNKYSNTFEYTYVVPSARIHTNADQIQQAANGYYYHTWQVNLDNLDESGESEIKIEYWTVTANTYVWYIIALVGAGAVITTIYFVGKNKEKKESQKDAPFLVE